MTWLQAGLVGLFLVFMVIFSILAYHHVDKASGTLAAIVAAFCLALAVLIGFGGLGFPPGHFLRI